MGLSLGAPWWHAGCMKVISDGSQSFKYVMTLGQKTPLEHEFSAEAHDKNLLPIRSPKCPQTQVGRRNSRVLTLTLNVPFLPFFTLPRRSFLVVPQNVFPKVYPESVTFQKRNGNSGLNRTV